MISLTRTSHKFTKKTFAITALFLVAFNLLAPFSVAHAQTPEPDPNTDEIFVNNFKGSTVGVSFPNEITKGSENYQTHVDIKMETGNDFIVDENIFDAWYVKYGLAIVNRAAFAASLFLGGVGKILKSYTLVDADPQGDGTFDDSRAFVVHIKGGAVDTYLDFTGNPDLKFTNINQKFTLNGVPNAQGTQANAVFKKGVTYTMTAYYRSLCSAHCEHAVKLDDYNSGLTTSNPKTYYPFATKTFTIEQAIIDQSSVTGTSYSNSQSSSEGNINTSDLPECNIVPVADILGCFARVVYYVLFVPTSFIFSLAGQLFDFSMGYTLDSASYGKTADSTSFVEKGWTITRDIANIFFILILLYIAIATIFDLGISAKKAIPMLVVVALLINFSLFFTRVVIDAGNILGTVFYNGLGTDKVDTSHSPWVSGDSKNISVALVAKFNPQVLFESAKSLKLNTPGGVNTGAGTSSNWPIAFAIITLIMSIINLVGAYIFFVIAFLFIGRVIALWLLMIFAPIAFISIILPGGFGGKLGDMEWGKWKDTLISQTFMVPIFLFFLYLIIMFLNTSFFSAAVTAGSTTTQKILGVIIPLMLLTFMLIKAKDTAMGMAGEMGKKMSGITGFAGGALLGGTAMLGRQTLGRAGNALANSESMKKFAARSSFGRSLQSGAQSMGKGSFDARQVKVMGKSLNSAGIDMGSGKTGGFDKIRKDAKEARIKRATSLEVGPDEQLSKDLYAARQVKDEEERKAAIKKAEEAIKKENSERRNRYADTVEGSRRMRYGKRGADETADAIRKGTKPPKKNKDGDEVPAGPDTKKQEDILQSILDALKTNPPGGTPPPRNPPPNNPPPATP